jgi:hypothetical protein
MLNKKYYLLLCIGFLIASCASNKIPEGWLPYDYSSFVYNANGGYMFLEYSLTPEEMKKAENDSSTTYVQPVAFDDLKNKNKEIRGEFLGMRADTVFLIAPDNKLYRIAWNKVSYGQLEYGTRNPGSLALWGIVGTLVTPFVNGLFSTISFPINIIATIFSLSGESGRNLYYEVYPPREWFNEVSAFARFPQGISDDIELNKIKYVNRITHKKTNYRRVGTKK